MIDINDLKRDLLDYDSYYLLDAVPYGDYQLSILNEGDKIIIYIKNLEGFAAWPMSKKEFLSIKTTEELKKHINSVLYYNYIRYEGE